MRGLEDPPVKAAKMATVGGTNQYWDKFNEVFNTVGPKVELEQVVDTDGKSLKYVSARMPSCSMKGSS